MGSIAKGGHKRDTRLKAYSTPQINRDNPQKWYIFFNYSVPEPLRKYTELYTRSTKRFKVYQGINSVRGTEREALALELREAVEHALKLGLLNPFANELAALSYIAEVRQAPVLSEEERRRQIPLSDALLKFMDSRRSRGIKPKSLMAYQSTANWLTASIGAMPVDKIKYLHISQALEDTARAKSWGPTSINKEWEFANTVFFWLVNEDYIPKNPITGRLVKLKTSKSIHKWYDRETAERVKKQLIKTDWLYRVCQFTYWILIRSKSELQSIKVGDIDFNLQQVRFRKEWTKNATDQNRDYPQEFATVLEQMQIKGLPADWYIFGKDGKPGPEKCGHNYFSRFWERERKVLGLGPEYTIYGWKHTRIVHMMMLNLSSYEIAHAARHGNTKTTEDYKRDYDITLSKVYNLSDLTF